MTGKSSLSSRLLLLLLVFREITHSDQAAAALGNDEGEGKYNAVPDPVFQSQLPSPWGSSSFSTYPDYYSGAGQLDIRRSGWSWPNPDYLSNYGPFCVGGSKDDAASSSANVCYLSEASSACKKSGGTPINDGMFCAFHDRPKTVLGPTCWDGTCYRGTEDVCRKHGGQSIAGTWCILEDDFSVVGPAAFANSTYPQLESVCEEIGGDSIGSLWCVVKKQVTVIGPANLVLHTPTLFRLHTPTLFRLHPPYTHRIEFDNPWHYPGKLL